jgi:hypothetical protein
LVRSMSRWEGSQTGEREFIDRMPRIYWNQMEMHPGSRNPH